jgi:hypothetical protein
LPAESLGRVSARSSAKPDTSHAACLTCVIGLLIWARIDDQRQRSLVTGYPGRLPEFRITKTSEAVCMQAAVSEWPTVARRQFRGGYYEA